MDEARVSRLGAKTNDQASWSMSSQIAVATFTASGKAIATTFIGQTSGKFGELAAICKGGKKPP